MSNILQPAPTNPTIPAVTQVQNEKRHTIYCRYSGMPLPSYADFPSLPIDLDAHIIMRAPLAVLIEEINKRRSLTDRQQRLIFIALLKQTDLCIFEHPALPSERIIEQEMPRLIEICYYICSHRSFYLTFPKFKITRKDPQISNLTHVISAWYDVKTSHAWTMQQRKELKEIEAFEEIEQKVTKAILKRQPLTPTFNKHLIRWALTISHSPELKRIKWAKIFLTKDSKLCRMCIGKKLLLNPVTRDMEKCPNCEGTGRVSDIDKLKYTEVQELRNFMMDSLPEETSYESTRKFAVLRHLAIKVQKIKQLHAAFGLELLSDDKPRSAEELKEMKGLIAEEPKKESFSSTLEYLRALAKFRAAQSVVESDEPEINELEQEDLPELEDEETNIEDNAPETEIVEDFADEEPEDE